MQLHLGPVVTPPIPLGADCRQGSPATPFLWTQLLAGPLAAVQDQWRGKGPDIAWTPDVAGVALLVWADNVFVVACLWAQARERMAEVSRVVRELGLRFSDSSLEVLANEFAGEGTLEIRETRQQFALVQTLRVFGLGLDAHGSTMATIDFRITEARKVPSCCRSLSPQQSACSACSRQ